MASGDVRQYGFYEYDGRSQTVPMGPDARPKSMPCKVHTGRYFSILGHGLFPWVPDYDRRFGEQKTEKAHARARTWSSAQGEEFEEKPGTELRGVANKDRIEREARRWGKWLGCSQRSSLPNHQCPGTEMHGVAAEDRSLKREPTEDELGRRTGSCKRSWAVEPHSGGLRMVSLSSPPQVPILGDASKILGASRKLPTT